MDLQTDLRKLKTGATVVLHPNASNPLHDKPVKATYSDGYFYCEGSDPLDGPDYYFRDVLEFNDGWIER